MNKKIALICTMGGHFEQLINLRKVYNNFDHFWITNKNKQTETELLNEKRFFIMQAHYKKPWQYLLHVPFFIKIFSQEKPTHIISTGSGRTILVPFILSIFFKIKFVYVDTFSRVNGLSKFGKFLNKINYVVFVQWEKQNLKNTVYIGPVFEKESYKKNLIIKEEIVFVTLGTRKEQFTRLLKYLDDLITENLITQKVVVQSGFTLYKSGNFETFDFCSSSEIDQYIESSKFVITQESAGLATKCLKMNKKFIVVPREYKYKELPTASDMEEDLQFKLEQLGFTKVASSFSELKDAIAKINEIKVGFDFNNSFAIQTLLSIIEGKK